MFTESMNFIKRVFAHNPYVEYTIISERDLNTKIDEGFEVRETIYCDRVVQKEIVNLAQQKVLKEYVLRIPSFLVAIKENKLISNLRKKINIGVDNYPAFENMKEELSIAQNNVIRITNDRKPLEEENRYNIGFMSYLKQHLGSNAYLNYQNSFEAIRQARKANATKLPPEQRQ